MDDWQPIETAPTDGQMVRLKLSNGRETVGEYWEPLPVEIDPEQAFGGWAFDLAMAGLDSAGAEPTHWASLTPAQRKRLGYTPPVAGT